MSATFSDQLAAVIPHLLRYAKALTRAPSEADDLVQDTLERALTKQHLYVDGAAGGGSLKGWLSTLRHNLFVIRVHRLKRQVHVEGMPLDDAVGFPAAAVPPNQLDRCFLAELADLMARLSGGGGAVVMTVGLQGHSYDAAAARLRMPIGTIRSRLARSRSALWTAAMMAARSPESIGQAAAYDDLSGRKASPAT